jgi:hypothetical protein
MKTTVEISPSLFAEAKRYAQTEHTTLKALFEIFPASPVITIAHSINRRFDVSAHHQYRQLLIV